MKNSDQNEYNKKQLKLIKSFEEKINFFVLDKNNFCAEFILSKYSADSTPVEEREFIDAPELGFKKFLESFNSEEVISVKGTKVYHYSILPVNEIERTIAGNIKKIYQSEISCLKNKIIDEQIAETINPEKLYKKVQEITGKTYKDISLSNNILKIEPLDNREESVSLAKKFKEIGVESSRHNSRNKDDKDYNEHYSIQIKNEQILKILNHTNLPFKSILKRSYVQSQPSSFQAYLADEDSQENKSPIKKSKESSSGRF